MSRPSAHAPERSGSGTGGGAFRVGRNALRPMLRSWASPVAAVVGRGPLSAAVMGLRLGLASTAQVQNRTDRYYSKVSGRSGIEYASDAHNLRGWFAWERDLVTAYLPPRGRVFVFAAGGGREMLNLSRLGYEVDGCECHRELVAYGNTFLERHGVRARIAYAPPDAVPPIERRYDAAIVGWSSYGHVQRRAARIALLRALRGGCTQDARLLVSFHAREGVRYPFAIVSGTANLIRRFRRAYRVETGDVFGHSFAHCFTRKEIELELRDGGWTLLHYGSDASGYAVARRGTA